MDYEPQSTKKYINSMRSYCLAQTLTYLPYITAFFLFPYFPFTLSSDAYSCLTSAINSFGGFSAFVPVMLFIKTGPMGYDKSKLEPTIDGESMGIFS